jgi:hypothetical protein
MDQTAGQLPCAFVGYWEWLIKKVHAAALDYLIRFLVVELIYPYLNSKFDMSVIFIANYSFSWRRRSLDSESLLMTDFVNLKIKSTQSFRSAHRDRVYVRIFIGVSTHMYISIYVYTVFLT